MKILTRRFLACAVLLGMVSLIAVAGNINRTGTAGAQELLIPVGAQGVALGGSNMAWSTGVDAIYWNPAGVARGDGVEAMFSHMSYFGDIGIEYGAITVNAGDVGSLGFSIKAINFGNISQTTEDYPDGTGQTFSPAYVTTGLTYSKMLNDRISVGATVNIISEQIMSTSASGVSVDAGVQYNGLGIPGLKLGVAIKNVGPNMTFSGADLYRTGNTTSDSRGTQTYAVVAAPFELPSQMELGLAYDWKADDSNDLTISTDFENNNYQDDIWKFGLEYSFSKILFLRGGYNLSPNAPTDPTGLTVQLYDFSLGAGIKYNVGGVDMSFDYAYRHLILMTSENVFTVKLGF
jgi:hypothetical protein